MINWLIAYFAKNRVAANLLMVFFIIGGLVAAIQLPVQLLPNIDPRIVTVTVPVPGASPREIEEDVNRRVEESIIGLRGVDRVVTTAREGVGQLIVELNTFADGEAVLDSVNNAVSGIQGFPPLWAEQPDIELKQVDLEVLTLSVSSSSATDNQLRRVAELVQDELLALPTVSHVTLRGIPEREITIEITEEDLRRHGLTIARISRAIRSNSFNASFGELFTSSGSVVLHTVSKKATGAEFSGIPLKTRLNGTVITLGDVATIRDGFADDKVLARVNGDPAVLVRVDSNKNQSITEIAAHIDNWLSKTQFPPGVTVAVWNNRAAPAIERIWEIIFNSVLGVILVFICLIAIFDLRIAMWITIGIPLSFIGSLLFFDLADLTLNMGTIFGFFLLVGIVVDDSVVVGESIAAERESGKKPIDAAIDGARSVFAPLSVGVLTTILAFIPFLFITESRYQVVNVFPYVALFVLLVSLIEAFLILPAHLSHDKPWSLSPLSDIQARMNARLDGWRTRVIAPIVSWSVRHTVLTPVLGVAVIIASVLLISSGAVRFIVFDDAINTADSIQANLYFEEGIPFESTVAIAERFARAAELAGGKLEGDTIKSVSIIAGSPVGKLHATDKEADPVVSHVASIVVHYHDRPLRQVDSNEFQRAWRAEFGDVSSLKRIDVQSARLQTKPGIAYSLQFSDREVLDAAARQFTSQLNNLPGIYDVSSNLELGKRHFDIELTDEGRVAGLSLATVAQQLRASFYGLVVQRVQRGHDEVKVVVRYPRERRQSLTELARERIYTARGDEIPLSVAAKFTETKEYSTLTRIDGEKVVLVSGFADSSITTPRRIRKEIQGTIVPQLLDQFPGLKIDIDGSARDEATVLKVLGILTPIVLLAMYGLTATFLRSYWKPFIVVFGLPVALAGAVVAHWVLGWDFSAMSLFGALAVGGVIVNDGLVLLDRYNTLRTQKPELPAIAAASASMHHRFRAVFLTSLTTLLALSPMLYERSDELLVLVPFIASMMGGLVFASLFVLFILPNIVMLIEGRRE